MAAKIKIAIPTNVPPANVAPLNTPPPAMGGNVDAALATLRLAIVAEREASGKKEEFNTSVKTNRETSNKAIAAATGNVMLAATAVFRANPDFTSRDMAIEYHGEEKFNAMNKRVRGVRVSEWGVVEDAARDPVIGPRIDGALWDAAGSKERFFKALRTLETAPAMELPALAEILKVEEKSETGKTDGDHLSAAIDALSMIKDNAAVIALEETMNALDEARTTWNGMGQMLTTKQIKERAKPAKATTPDKPMSIRDRIALAKAASGPAN